VNSLHRLGVSEADALAVFEAHPNGPASKYIEGGPRSPHASASA
jgi:hypothetical protein